MRVNRYPLWKNLLLLIIIILGFIYALPVVFGENPSVQISGKHGVTINAQTLSHIENILHNEKLNYLSAALSHQDIFIRFSNAETDIQLKASDALKTALGDDYTVALNLSPATPAWLQAINAMPIKLGLDLRGGVHFLLSVDVNSVITHRQEGAVNNIMSILRDKKIRYTDVSLQSDKSIVVSFRDAAQKEAALSYLPNEMTDLNFKDTSQNNSYKINAVLTPAALQRINQSTLDQTMTTLRNRVNELGVSEAIVQQQGNDRVSVDLPGIQDTAHAKEILGGTATVEFHLVDTTHDAHNAQLSGTSPIGTTLYPFENSPVLLKNQIVLAGASITDASAGFDENGRPSVNIRLGGGGERMFNRITAANVGNPMATVYTETTIDNEVLNGKAVKIPKKSERIINIATIQSALGNSFQITGLSSQPESQNLALLLRAGALPATINYEEERLVGPTLGQENIHKGILSVEAAMLLVIIFMGCYYRVFGLIANVALLLNLVLLIAVLSLLGATLSLPGIAAIVLTLGMAVDANVLIFERIREELRLGLTTQASIYAGYERALVTIIDANITTLIVAMVLFGIGTEAVKGFAVTLTLGLLTSMLTAIMVTRAMVNIIYGARNVKKLSIGI
jgi:preprotein translocase subunit SecD